MPAFQNFFANIVLQDTYTNWCTSNPVLVNKQLVITTDGYIVIGDGVTAFASIIPSFNPTSSAGAPASTESTGLVELATRAEVFGGDDNSRVPVVSDLNLLLFAERPNKNLIVNGDFRISQRGDSFTDPTGYTRDRWWAWRTTASSVGLNVDYVEDCDKFSSLGLPTVPAVVLSRTPDDTTDVPLRIGQCTSSEDAYIVAGKSCIASALVYIDAADTYSSTEARIAVEYSTESTDVGFLSATFTTIVSEIFTLVPGTPQPIIASFDVPSDATQLRTYITFVVAGTAGETDKRYMTHVQLIPAESYRPFVPQPLALELARCYKYYYRSGPNAANLSMYGCAGSNGIMAFTYKWPTKMRTTPAVSFGGTWAASNSAEHPTAYSVSDEAALVGITTTSGTVSSFNPYPDGYIVADAELTAV